MGKKCLFICLFSNFVCYFFQDLEGARHDVLVSLYLDPENKEIVSIFSRLFPGRAITDVMKSHMGMAAARQAEASIRETNSYQELSQHATGTTQLRWQWSGDRLVFFILQLANTVNTQSNLTELSS